MNNTYNETKSINGIPMIPFGLLSGFILFASGYEKEIRVTELAENGFMFRLAKNQKIGIKQDPLEKYKEDKGDVTGIRLCFYDMERAEYREIDLQEIQIARTDSNTKGESALFYDEYQVLINIPDYTLEVRRLAGQYNHYISLKLNADDEELARELIGYPEKRKLVQNQEAQKRQEEFLSEVAVELDRPELYERFLIEDAESFFQIQTESSANDWVRSTGEAFQTDRRILNYLLKQRERKKPDRIYIGNQFCPLLFPQEEKLIPLLEKSRREGFKITISFSYMQEDQIEKTRKLLSCIDTWCEQNQQTIEVVLNDWGMAKLVQEKMTRMTACLGSLLNKRRKDPRLSWKKGNLSYFRENSLNAEFYREFLQEEYGIQRYEWEACGYRQKLPRGENSLHLPFYQTNTSQYCPVYAMCVHGKRGIQETIKTCPEYCRNHRFVYSEDSNLTGRFNSLFGIDVTVGKSSEQIREYLENYKICGIDRFVISLL